MFAILDTTVPQWGVKEDIPTGTERGQTVKDVKTAVKVRVFCGLQKLQNDSFLLLRKI